MDRRIYGVETEYAMSLEGADRRLEAADPGALFDRLEGALLDRFITLEGDSFGRDPHGARGGGIEIKEGRFLESGARFYYDAGHVEWATPECTSAREAALYELAGERTLAELARGLDLSPGKRLLLLKNNIDYAQDRTFGCHENYLVPRKSGRSAERAAFARLVEQLVPFLVTRQIFAGAGKLGSADLTAPYQLSQRADFIECVLSTETRSERGIVNTRDESLGDERRYRRLHLIVGDSNRSAFASFLKLGTTGIVLQLIENDALGRVPALADPVAAIKAVSRDLTCRKPIPLATGGSASPVAVQTHYLESAERYYGARPADEVREILECWRKVVEDLQADPVCVADRVDWMIKLQHLLDPRCKRAGVGWREVGAWNRVLAELRRSRPAGQPRLAPPSDEECARFQYLLDRHGLHWNDFEVHHRLFYELRECDLRYHDIDRERGLFSVLERAELVMPLFDEQSLVAAQGEPPDSRARLRAQVIRWAHRHGHAGDTLLDWGRVSFATPPGAVELGDPFASADAGIDRHLELEEELSIRILGVEEAEEQASWPGEMTKRLRRLLGR